MRFTLPPAVHYALWLSISLFLANGSNLYAALIHRWNFNEGSGTNVLDSVGTSHGWVVVSNMVDYTRTTTNVGLGGGGWTTSDFIQMPSGMVSSLTNVTIEVWATPRSAQNWSRIFDFGPNVGGGAARDFYLSFCIGTSLNAQRLEHDPTPNFRVDTALATTVSNQYHYVVTWSKTGGAQRRRTGGVVSQRRAGRQRGHGHLYRHERE